MPTIKTNASVKKRFKPKGSGYKYRQANRNHILTKKSPKRKRKLRGLEQASSESKQQVDRLLRKC